MKINFFDWDDTIVFTRKAQYLSYRDAIKLHIDFDLDWKMFNQKFYGHSNIFLASIGCSDLEIKSIRKKKSQLYLETYANQIELLIGDFDHSAINVIVSNTTEKTIRGLLEQLKIPPVFEFIVAADSYHGANRKPAPDLYHYAFSKLKSFSNESDFLTIYEDSYEGAISALTFLRQVNIKNSKLVYLPCSLVSDYNDKANVDELRYYPKILGSHNKC